MRSFLISSIALAGLACGSPPHVAHAGEHVPTTVKGLCRLVPPEPVASPTSQKDGEDDVVVLGWRVHNKSRNVTIATCSEQHVSYRVTLREVRLRPLDSNEEWSPDLLKMGWDSERTPVGFVSFPSSDTCEYELRMVYDGFTRKERRTVLRPFNVCRYASMVAHVDQMKPDIERGGQALAALGK